MGQWEIEREIDSAKQEILSILSKKISRDDAHRIERILEEVKSKLRRGII